METKLGNVEVFSGLEAYAQAISKEMLEALKKAAEEKGISLDLEIAYRLAINIFEVSQPENTITLDDILNWNFPDDAAFAECKRKRESNLYLYEMEKLRLFMEFKDMLPRKFKETFLVLDVKEAMKEIAIELKNKTK